MSDIDMIDMICSCEQISENSVDHIGVDECFDIRTHAKWDNRWWMWAYHRGFRGPRYPVPAIYKETLDPDEQGQDMVWYNYVFFPPWRFK